MSEEIEITGEAPQGKIESSKSLARNLIDLVRGGGLTPEEAARRLGLDPAALRENMELREQMRNLLASYADIPSHVQKELVRAARLKILMKNVEGETPGEQKIALEAAKQIGSDPDVGLNLPPVPVMQVDMNTLEELFSKLPREPEVIDAEIIEDDNKRD